LGGRNFVEKDMALCEAIAGQAAIAIENATLHKKIVKTERLAAVGQTIAGLAHCIKNVLNGIQGGSYIIDLGLRKDEPSRVLKGWEIVKKNNAFMQELVLDMLTYSKERKPEYELTNINEIIEDVCDLMEQKAKESGVTVTWTPNTELSKVEVDPKGIRRCLLNLVSNAIDAYEGQQEGLVKVFTELVNNRSFKINISDNGCGMPDEIKEKLFQVFFSTKGSRGTGLGLSVTHKIITEHKGRIEVDSAVGKGTTFTIILPIKREMD
jgi:signal transduction histidine kinase